jgi:hypothetical protein
LKKLLEKDFGPCVRSGFETTGLYPLSLERALSKLPAEPVEVESAVQRQLLKKLNNMRYHTPPNTHAGRPKKKEKLPAGASYTCNLVEDSSDEDAPAVSRTGFKRGGPSGDSTDSSEYSSESSDEEERREAVQSIVARLEKKRTQFEMEEYNDEPEEQECAQDPQQEPILAPLQESAVDTALEFPPDSYIVAMYQGDWYVGQIMAKEGEPEAEEDDRYLLVSFMERTSGDLLKWPRRSDILNVLKEDILFACEPPTPCAATSSSRSVTYSLSRAESKKAKNLFMTKAYYPTTISFISFTYLSGSSGCLECVLVLVVCRRVVCTEWPCLCVGTWNMWGGGRVVA